MTMNLPPLDETGRAFLIELNRRVGGEPGRAGSLYEVGATLGLGREEARRLAEDLLGRGFLEIESLGGAVALTEEGLAQAGPAESAGGGQAEEVVAERLTLSLGPGGARAELAVLSPTAVAGLRELAAGLMMALGGLAPASGPAQEAAADLAGLTAQLGSPRPKAGAVRELLLSLTRLLAGQGEAAGKILPWLERLSRP
jgi:hypothetical protein